MILEGNIHSRRKAQLEWLFLELLDPCGRDCHLEEIKGVFFMFTVDILRKMYVLFFVFE